MGVVVPGCINRVHCRSCSSNQVHCGSCSSRVYLADLESALHYLLRVEVATHTTLQGAELNTFKDFVTVVAKVTMRLHF